MINRSFKSSGNSTENQTDMDSPASAENSPRGSPMGSSPGSTSSKHSGHSTLEQSNTTSVVNVDVVNVNIVNVEVIDVYHNENPTGTEPPTKKFKKDNNKSETVGQSADDQQDDLTGNTVNDDELELFTFENDPIDIEHLRLRFIELGITDDIKLPADEDFLTTENIFKSQDLAFPVNMKTISDNFPF